MQKFHILLKTMLLFIRFCETACSGEVNPWYYLNGHINTQHNRYWLADNT